MFRRESKQKKINEAPIIPEESLSHRRKLKNLQISIPKKDPRIARLIEKANGQADQFQQFINTSDNNIQNALMSSSQINMFKQATN